MKLAAGLLLLGCTTTLVVSFVPDQPRRGRQRSTHLNYRVVQELETWAKKQGIIAEQQNHGEADPLMQHEAAKVLKLVHGLHQRPNDDNNSDLQQLILEDERDSDSEVVDSVVTPEQLSDAPSVVTRRFIDATLHTPRTKKHTASIFSKLSDLAGALDEAFAGDNEIIKYAEYPNHAEYPDFDLSQMMKMADGVPPLEYWFSYRKFRRLIRRIALTTLGLSLTADKVKAAAPQEKFRAFFTSDTLAFGIPNPLNLVPLPKHTYEHWDEDSEFARQFMNGVNPLMIAVIKNVGEQVTAELRSHLEEQGLDLDSLSAENRLFVVDYPWLADLECNPHQAYPLPMNGDKPQDQARYFQAPQVILRMNKENKESLDILAIQLDREADAPVYTRNNTDANTWSFVKTCVANADSQYHQWVSHLGKTHLTMEPHIVAIHNTLRRSNHKLFTFAKPMVKDTLLLNWAARNTLAKYGDDSFGDYMTSVGTGQFLQLINRYWSTYDFFKSSALPEELASRGFDEDFEMPGYLYRKDGMRLWNAFGSFAKDFVDECYGSDEAVARDADLQHWARETSDPKKAAVKGFPTRFSDKATVVKTLQTLWWMCSGLHAAVNFPQADFYSYAPNKPLGMRANMEQFEKNGAAIEGRSWVAENALPDIERAKETISVAAALTMPSRNTLDKLDANFQTLGKESYSKFKKDLAQIGKEINARNQKNRDCGNAVYHYLHPGVVPASIDI